MNKEIYGLLISPLSLFTNPIYDYIIMGTIGYIAYLVAFGVVGDLGFRGKLGSIVHWIIRLYVYGFIWLLCCIMIEIVTFLVNNWIYFLVIVILLFIVYILKIYANKNPKSILNKEILKIFS